MKILSFILSLGMCFWLVSCEQSSNMAHEKEVSEHAHNSMPMQHLTMLLEHGVSMMAQGAELKLQGNKVHGDAMLKQSADLLRRAMSGPEMAAMHKGGQGQSPAMQHTHDLGAAAFDLLDLMMFLDAQKGTADMAVLHHALNMASEGESLISLSGMAMVGDIDQAMLEHGMQMQQASMALINGVKNKDEAYLQAILKVVHILINEPV